MFYDSPAEKGNPLLQPEHAITYEGGFRYVNGNFLFEANYFVRDNLELISWARPKNNEPDVTPPWIASNLGRVVVTGQEINFAYTVAKRPTSFLKKVNLSYTRLNQDFKNPGEDIDARYSIDYLRHQGLAGLELGLFKKLSVNGQLRLLDREMQNYYHLLDMRVSWQHNNALQFFAEGTNITNTEYFEVMTPMPGRWLRAGLKLDIGL